MDIKQINYILKIAEAGSISKAAESLYITQSALNQQLLKLERELGLPLFERQNRTVKPTYAGKLYLEAARKIVDIRDETYKMLQDVSTVKRGEITLAYTPERGSRAFSRIYPEFHAIYPEITFKIFESRVVRMQQLLERGEVAIAMIAYQEQNPKFEYHSANEESIVLAVPTSNPLSKLAGENSHISPPQIDLSLFRDEQFVMMTHETLMRYMVDDAFERAGFEPQVLFESTSTMTVVNMVNSQVGVAFFPQSYVIETPDIAYFTLDHDMTWKLSLASKKGAYLNQAERDFIEIAKKYV